MTRNFCCVLTVAAVSATAALWAAVVHTLTLGDIWYATLAHPALTPECGTRHMRERGRHILHNVLSAEQCAAIKHVQSVHQGHPSKALNWGMNLFDHFRSHFVSDWRHTDGGDAAREIVANLITQQQRLLSDPGNSVLQAHDITVRSAIKLSRPLDLWARWSWLWGDVEAVAELDAGSQRPHGDNCSLSVSSTNPAVGTIPYCSVRELHLSGVCCGARMYTAGVYLDQPGEADGGNFMFWDFDTMDLWRLRTGFCHIKPLCGTMVVFPADRHNLHAVGPVLRGDRTAIMTWFTNDTNTALQDRLLTPFSEWDYADSDVLQQRQQPEEKHSLENGSIEMPTDVPSTGIDYQGPPPPGYATTWDTYHGYVALGWLVDASGQLVQAEVEQAQ